VLVTTLDERPPQGQAPPAVGALTLDFLAWVACRPRTYAEAMEAWRTSCPRFPIWEDAIDDGLVRLQPGPARRLSAAIVVLTPRGRAVLDRG
jgi:hypothetical protein